MAIVATQRAVNSFRVLSNSINCRDVIGIDLKAPTAQMIVPFLLRGGPVRCLSLAASYGRASYNEIRAAYLERHIDAPPVPVSCAAMLAQKMGASDLHTVMTAGLAGGIGLSGGACGALGAAIWMAGITSRKDGGGGLSYKSPRAMAALDRLSKGTGGEIECSKIVGRKFASVADHADYLRAGGCAEIVNALATALAT